MVAKIRNPVIQIAWVRNEPVNVITTYALEHKAATTAATKPNVFFITSHSTSYEN